MVGRVPVIEHVIHHAVKTFLRRIPGFHEVMVHVDAVDGANGRIGVRVSRQQGALGFRVKLDGLFQELHARHARHSLVHEEQRHGLVAEFQPLYGFKGRSAGIRGDDLVTVTVLAAQVALHGAQHIRIIVHSPDYRFGHKVCFSSQTVYHPRVVRQTNCQPEPAPRRDRRYNRPDVRG